MTMLLSRHGPSPAVLEADGLRLRPFKITDADRLARITSDLLVTRNLLRTTTPFTTHEARARILRLRTKASPVWAIDNGKLIGLIGIAGEFGYWLGRSAWGKDYASHAARLVIAHAFHRLGIETLHANPMADNGASRHLLEKLGFEACGRDLAFCQQRQRMVHIIRYRLYRSGCASRLFTADAPRWIDTVFTGTVEQQPITRRIEKLRPPPQPRLVARRMGKQMPAAVSLSYSASRSSHSK